MASKAFVLGYASMTPTYNDSMDVVARVAYVENSSMFDQNVSVNVLLSDTIAQMGSKIATAIRAQTPAGISAIAASNVYMPTYQRS